MRRPYCCFITLAAREATAANAAHTQHSGAAVYLLNAPRDDLLLLWACNKRAQKLRGIQALTGSRENDSSSGNGSVIHRCTFGDRCAACPTSRARRGTRYSHASVARDVQRQAQIAEKPAGADGRRVRSDERLGKGAQKRRFRRPKKWMDGRVCPTKRRRDGRLDRLSCIIRRASAAHSHRTRSVYACRVQGRDAEARLGTSRTQIQETETSGGVADEVVCRPFAPSGNAGNAYGAAVGCGRSRTC